MTRTPLSIVREVKDFRRTGSTCRPSGGFRHFAHQPNLAPVDLDNSAEAVSRPSLQRGSQSQRRLPSLPNPFTSRSSKAAKESGERRRAPSESSARPPRQRVEDNSDAAHAPASPSTPGSPALHSAHERGVTQLTAAQAVSVLEELQNYFSDAHFQNALKRLQSNFPQRKTRGHSDGPAFFESFERLTLGVYKSVLPTYGFSGDWDGVADFQTSLHTAKSHVGVKELQEHINILMGLPRDATFRPQKRKDELLVYRPNGDGGLPDWLLLPQALKMDSDGDEAHEFWEEDPASGALLPL